MVQRIFQKLSVFAMLLILGVAAGTAWAQGGTRGTVTITVLDSSGLTVQGAQLTLVDLKTNDVRTGVTLEKGNYTFTGLLSGTYKLAVEKSGFATQNFDAILVEAARTTDVTAKLQVGSTTTNIEVTAETSPLVESSSNAIGTNIDVKQIEDLPLGDRNISGFSAYVPGAANGIFNGMRGASQTNTMDGVVASSSRFKDGGNKTPANEPRIENIEEMVVQTDQLDLNQGYGQANMQVGFTTRRGGTSYHGRVYGDLQNDAFNAPGWMTDYYAKVAGKDPDRYRAKYHKNEFGGTFGGRVPIPRYKDKFFFFASYSQDSIPGAASASNNYPNASLQAGNYSYTDTNGTTETVNLLTLAGNQGLPSTVNAKVAQEFSNINASTKLGLIGVDAGDAFNIEDITFNSASNRTWYYPTFRVDYNASQNLRVNLSFNETKFDAPTGGMPWYPGSTYNVTKYSNSSRNYTASLGVEWAIKPTLLNQLRGGYLYTFSGGVPVEQGHTQDDVVWWNMPEMNYYSSGDIHAGQITHFYPLASLSDNLVWQHGTHNVTVGGSWYREQDHYWDNPLGYNNIVFGAVGGDPAAAAFVDSTMPNSSYSQQQIAWNFYTLLTGRLNVVAFSDAYHKSTGKFSPGAVNLDELQQAWGMFAQDSWHVTPHFTFNYGIRWDFTGDDHDLNGAYHSISRQDLWGQTGYMNQFHPGSFLNANGTPSFVGQSHAYSPWNVSPQPSFAVAWNPSASEDVLGKLLGGESTVIRAGYALRNYTEAYQNFWNYASNYGAFYYNNSFAQAAPPTGSSQAAGTFAPGAYSWGDTIPQSTFVTDYTTYQPTITEESVAFYGQRFGGIDRNIKQPSIQSWNLGIQRALGKSNAIEARYVGNHAIHEWIPLNPNEVNVFENGFLAEFKKAQANLAANGGSSFANNSLSGQSDLPIMTAAFGGDDSQWSNQSFISYLQNGQVGSFAQTLTQANYLCNMVGNFTGPCVNNVGLTGTGVGPYPNNFFQANPYASGRQIGYLTSTGSSNYHSLQVEFRQKNFHGANFTANYTFAKNLGIRPFKSGDSSNFNLVTMRSMRLSYNPSDSDIRHTFNLLGTYDLPVGKGKMLNISNGLANAVVGDWTLGTVTTFHSGLPFLLTGGNMTFNDSADGGIALNGVTVQQLRKSVGVYRQKGTNYADLINPKYLSSTYLQPNTTPGTLGVRPWLWAPHVFNTDLSLSKGIQIREGVRFSLQGEFLNAFNHPTWGADNSDASVSDIGGGFARTSPGGARHIEIRANFEF